MLVERFVLGSGTLLECEVGGAERFRLAFSRGGEVLVEYRPGSRRFRGRRTDYAFRSIEQLRYDFERDVRDAGLA